MSAEIVFSSNPQKKLVINPGKAEEFQSPTGERVVVYCRPSNSVTTVFSTEILGYSPRNWFDKLLRRNYPVYGKSITRQLVDGRGIVFSGRNRASVEALHIMHHGNSMH